MSLYISNEYFHVFRFDYGEKFWVIKHKYFTCHCASEKCRYSRSNINMFLREYYKRNGEPLPPELQSPGAIGPAPPVSELSKDIKKETKVENTPVTTTNNSAKPNKVQDSKKKTNNSADSKKNPIVTKTEQKAIKTPTTEKRKISDKKTNESSSNTTSPILAEIEKSPTLVIPLTKVNVKALTQNEENNATKEKQPSSNPNPSSNLKKQDLETSSTTSNTSNTTKSTRPRRSVTIKNAEEAK